VGHADLAEAIAIGQIGNGLHLLCAGIARDLAGRLQRNVDDGKAGLLVRCQIGTGPQGEVRPARNFSVIGAVAAWCLVGRWREEGGDAVDLGLGYRGLLVRYPQPFPVIL
jgi:hypothetical protein